MENGILSSVKKMLGIADDYTAFDTDIIMNINAALSVCMQLGVGPQEGFAVTGYDETWTDFLADDERQLQEVKMYVYMRTKVTFDPPANSFVQTSLENQMREYEWRMNVQVDPRSDD